MSLGVECRLGLLAWTELIHVTLADEQHDALVSFVQPYFEGHVVENAPPKSAVNGLRNISVSVTNFQGRVLKISSDVQRGTTRGPDTRRTRTS